MAASNFASESVWTGDKLTGLRGISSGCIDLIYLNSPFNSNRHYEAPSGARRRAPFKDAWTLNDVDVCKHGELAYRNPGVAYSFNEAARQSHGKGMQAYLNSWPRSCWK